MLTVTYEQFLDFDPCWLEKEGGKERLQSYFKNGPLSALDILKFEDVSIRDRLWAVCREELINENILHEFGCRCAESLLSVVENPNPKSLEAIRIKRLWMKGEATNEELKAARKKTSSAYSVFNGELDANASSVGCTWVAASDNARDSALGASDGVFCIVDNAQRQCLVEELIKMLEEMN